MFSAPQILEIRNRKLKTVNLVEVSTESGSDRVAILAVSTPNIKLDPVATAPGTDSIKPSRAYKKAAAQSALRPVFPARRLQLVVLPSRTQPVRRPYRCSS